MRLFLSYPSAQRPLAERLVLALEAEGHEVFFDRQDLDAGEAFHERIREGIARSEAMVLLLTPDALRAGTYVHTEIELARQRWPHPSGHLLPVLLSPIPAADLPAYVAAVTLLQPRGDPVAEAVAAVARLGAERSPRLRRLGRYAAAGATVAIALTAGVVWQRHREAQAEVLARKQAREAAEARLLAQARVAREACVGSGHAVALAELNLLSQPGPPTASASVGGSPAGTASAPDNGIPAGVLDLREDCAMLWLREMRVTVGKTTLTEQLAVAQPVLLQGLARSSGQRAADLRAHLGWGEYLRSREGTPGADPGPHWRRALTDEAGNVYAHAMWGRQLLDRNGGLGEAREHFNLALASGRNKLFVRGLQLGGSVGGSDDLQAYALTVVNDMRRQNDKLLDVHRERLWSRLFSARMTDERARDRLLVAVPPAEQLQTFLWMFPPATIPEDRRWMWRFTLAALQGRSGERAQARAGLEGLAREMRAENATGSLLNAVEKELGRWK